MTVRSTYSAHRRLVVGVIVLAVAAAGATGLATSAFFSDSAAVTTGAFATGTVSLTASPATLAFTVPAMIPGDKAYAPITVTNDGTLPLRYSMTSATTIDTSGMATAGLRMTIKTVTAAGNCTAGAGWTGATTMTGAAVGPMALGSAGGLPIIGTIAPGGQTSDQTVLGGAPQILCVEVELPTTWAVEGSTAAATFTFNAEQTTNN